MLNNRAQYELYGREASEILTEFVADSNEDAFYLFARKSHRKDVFVGASLYPQASCSGPGAVQQIVSEERSCLYEIVSVFKSPKSVALFSARRHEVFSVHIFKKSGYLKNEQVIRMHCNTS